MTLKKPAMTFRIKVLLFIIPLLLLISFLHTVDSIRVAKEAIRNEIIKRAEAITTLATRTGELPIISGNPKLLRNTATFLKSSKEIAAVSFYDSRMTLLIHEGTPAAHLGAPPAASVLSMSEEEHAFVFYAPVFSEKREADFEIVSGASSAENSREVIGWVRIAFSKESLEESQNRIVVRGSTLSLLFAAASCLAAYILMGVATRPLSQLARMADGVSHGDFSQQFQLQQQGAEIWALYNSFSAMRETISRVLKETQDLIAAVQEGRLDSRSNAGQFEGEWRNLVEEVNELAASFAKGVVELRNAKEAAETANQAKSAFLSNMSHELRTPLNAILGYAQILKMQDNLTPPQRNQLDIMFSSGEHLLSLINDVLDVSKIEAQKMDVEQTIFNLSALVRQAVNLTRLNAEEKKLELNYSELSPLPVNVRGDERKLRQILLNLLSNAVKYTEQGSITLRVAYRYEGGGILQCEVVDTGIGIPEQRLEDIFEPFTQLANGNRLQEGTGLGLNITKRLLELMQGRLTVTSEVGKGSSFSLELPLPHVPMKPEQVPSAPAAMNGYAGSRKRILVVDDFNGSTAMLVSLLTQAGFVVDTASNGREGFDKALENHPDLVLLDLVMPLMDGMETVQLMRACPELNQTVIIGTSAPVSENGSKIEFLKYCDDFISKPVRIHTLLDMIASHLGLSWNAVKKDQDRPGSMDQDLPVPPPDQLKVLQDLALRGDMLAIEEWADRLTASDSRYGAFAGKLKELAGGFKTRALLELVKRSLGENHD